MPRSSFSDNPLLRVSRPVSACSRCRAAKVKCDGKLPACTACEKAGRETECSAANDQFARGKERSYVAALELRIEKLERRLAYARQRKASVAMHDPDAPPSGDATGRKDSLVVIRDAIHRKAARKRENSDVNSLVSDFGYLSVNATTRDFEPSVTNMTFARLVLAAATNDPLPVPRTTKLPPQQAAYATVQFYLSNIFPLYPIFSDTALLALVDDVYKEDRRPVRSPEQWLFWMVLAIGSTAQSRNMQDEYYTNGVEFVSRALAHADRALRPGCVSQIQSLALLTQYSMLDPAHFDSWHLRGFTCRAVIDLGYHQDPSPIGTLAIDKVAMEIRRRTFYCVFALDRAISMVHARAFSFTDDSVSVELPSPTRPPPPVFSGGTINGPPSTEASYYLFRLRQLQSYWYQNLFQTDPSKPIADSLAFIWQVCLDMREWSESLPDSLSIGIREMLELELRYSYVYCIAPSARTPNVTDYGRLLIYEHAIFYIDRIHDIAHATINSAFYTYHDALRVYFMGSQFVAVLRDAADALFSGVRMPVSVPGKAPAPPLPQRDRNNIGDHLQRSLRSLERVDLTLKKYSERWEDALSLMGSFEMMSSSVIEDLKAKIARNAEQQQQQQQPQHQSQHQQFHSQLQHQHQQQQSNQVNQSLMYQHQRRPLPQQMPQQQQQEVRWVDVDVAQIIRGGDQI